MNFDASSNSIKSLFRSPRYYKIPRFQRDFSWGNNNYKEFLEDLISQIIIEEENSKIILRDSKYFLGNMLFLGGKDDSYVEVIDGQQRLTTSTILLAAIRDSLSVISELTDDTFTKEDKKNAKNYSDTIQKNYLIETVDGEPIRKLKTTSSYPYFTQKIQDFETKNESVLPQTDEEELLHETFEFFKEKLKYTNFIKLFNKINNKDKVITLEQYVPALRALRDQLLSSEIVEIFVTDRDQANKIFENINSKGKPLSEVDLIKNVIFSKIDVTSAGVDEISTTWLDFNRKLSKLNESISDTITFNEFFLHYWKAVYPKDRATGTNLYKKFNERFGNVEKEELLEFVNDLNKGLDVYIEIINPDSNNYTRQSKKFEYEYLTAIKHFRGIQVRAALLSYYLKLDKLDINKKSAMTYKLLQVVSDFHFIASGYLLKIHSNKSTAPYQKFAFSIQAATDRNDLKKAISELERNLFINVEKEPFINAFKELTFTKKGSKNSFASFPAAFAIKQIEKFLANKTSEYSDASIEHIIDEMASPKSIYIGNLVLLETDLNNELSNLSTKDTDIDYLKEKTVVYKKSRYLLISELLSFFENKKFNIDEWASHLAEIYWTKLTN